MISYDTEIIGLIALFERMTGAAVKDCFRSNDAWTFVVQPGEMGKAIGKQGTNIRRVSSAIRKPVKVIEFDPDAKKFVLNLLYPLKPAEVKQEDKYIIIKAHNVVEKGKIFGREKTNLKRIQERVSKYFPYEVRVE